MADNTEPLWMDGSGAPRPVALEAAALEIH